MLTIEEELTRARKWADKAFFLADMLEAEQENIAEMAKGAAGVTFTLIEQIQRQNRDLLLAADSADKQMRQEIDRLYNSTIESLRKIVQMPGR